MSTNAFGFEISRLCRRTVRSRVYISFVQHSKNRKPWKIVPDGGRHGSVRVTVPRDCGDIHCRRRGWRACSASRDPKCSARSDGDEATFAEGRVGRQVIVGAAPGAGSNSDDTRLGDRINFLSGQLAIEGTLVTFLRIMSPTWMMAS